MVAGRRAPVPRANERNRLNDRNNKNLIKDNMMQVIHDNAVAQRIKNKNDQKEADKT